MAGEEYRPPALEIMAGKKYRPPAFRSPAMDI
jgi:hypothetical protein